MSKKARERAEAFRASGGVAYVGKSMLPPSEPDKSLVLNDIAEIEAQLAQLAQLAPEPGKPFKAFGVVRDGESFRVVTLELELVGDDVELIASEVSHLMLRAVAIERFKIEVARKMIAGGGS